MSKTAFTMKSHDGRTELHGYMWEPEQNVVGIVQLVHGMQEYIDRYDDFAGYLNTKGYFVIGHDHLGHGDSVCSKEDWGFFEENNGNSVLLSDIHQVRTRAQEKYPDVPYIILGHSMGSFLTRQYLCLRGEGICAAIIMGTGSMPKEVLRFAMSLSALIAGIKGWRFRSQLIKKIAFGSYNKRINPCRTKYDWLTRDVAIVGKYAHEPRNTFDFTVNGYYNLFYSMFCLTDSAYLAGMPKDLPVLLVSGEEDPVGAYGEGPKAVKEQFDKLGMEHVDLKLYPGDRHEILNELDRKKVYEDLADWIDERRSR